jgi:hypothetical protein
VVKTAATTVVKSATPTQRATTQPTCTRTWFWWLRCR